jgi:hypothetical protein
MRKPKEYRYVLKLDKYEYGITLNALDRYRLKLESQNQDTTQICQLILKIIS